MSPAAGIDVGRARRIEGARAFLRTVVIAWATLDASTAGAGCCDYGIGCYDTNDSTACEANPGGTFLPDPYTCDFGGDPATCSTGTATTTTTTLPGFLGFADGRLNPDPGEYYSIWCAFDQIDVWRTVPINELVKTVPIVDVISLPVGGNIGLGDFMSLVRSSEDTVTVYGSNGNLAPEPGSKSFSLSECIERNGGPPDASEPPSGPERGEPSSEEEETAWEAEARRAHEHREAIESCYDLYESDASLLVDCLEFVSHTYKGIGQCWIPVFRFRITGSPSPDVAAGRPLGAARPRVMDSRSFNFLALYLQLTRLRDDVFAGTAGGRRATNLYYASNGSLLQSAVANPAVLTAGYDALEAWAPVVQGLTQGDGTAPAVSAAQVEAFERFLAEARAGASPALRLALEREVLLVDPESFLGLTPVQMVERLERLSCEAAPDLASLQCRLADLSRIVDAHVPRKVRKRLASRLAKATKQAKRAEAAGEGTKRRRKALRRTKRLLRSAERRLGRKKVAGKLGEDVRLVLGADVAALRADAQTLETTQ
jgi:hypothetical protein